MDYYKLIGIDINKDDINNINLLISNCNKKLSSYKYLPFLSSSQENDCKELQKAKYIFMNKEFKNKYDNILFRKNNNNNNSFDGYQDSQSDNLFSLNLPDNDLQTSSLHLKDNNIQGNNSRKKEKINTSSVGDRIFSMVGILNNNAPNIEANKNFFNQS